MTCDFSAIAAARYSSSGFIGAPSPLRDLKFPLTLILAPFMRLGKWLEPCPSPAKSRACHANACHAMQMGGRGYCMAKSGAYRLTGVKKPYDSIEVLLCHMTLASRQPNWDCQQF